MKGARVLPMIALSFLLLVPRSALAADGGCVDDGGSPCDAGAAPPMPCDGGDTSLCDTTNGAGCSSAGEPVEAGWVMIALTTLALILARRRHLRSLPGTERLQ
jgi:uncharacterized protein (TIGR03382 family)